MPTGLGEGLMALGEQLNYHFGPEAQERKLRLSRDQEDYQLNRLKTISDIMRVRADVGKKLGANVDFSDLEELIGSSLGVKGGGGGGRGGKKSGDYTSHDPISNINLKDLVKQTGYKLGNTKDDRATYNDLNSEVKGRQSNARALSKVTQPLLSAFKQSTQADASKKSLLNLVESTLNPQSDGAVRSTGALKVLDKTTAHKLLMEAGGDKSMARELAKQKGYKLN